MRAGFKLLLITLPIIALGAAFLAYNINNKTPPLQKEAIEHAVAVRVIKATNSTISAMASGFGIIMPERNYEAIAQVSGAAKYVSPLLKKGNILPKGTVLVRLNDKDYRLIAAQSQANIRSVEARLAEIGVSESNLKVALAIEEETLNLKNRELERANKLYQSGTSSQAVLEKTESAYLAQKQKMQNLKSSLALVEPQRLVQKEQIAVHRASLEIAELNIERTELRLPFDARVGDVMVEQGQLVRSGQVVAKLDGINAAEVEAQIAVADVKTLFNQHQTGVNYSMLDPAALTNILLDVGVQVRVQMKLGDEYIDWPAKVSRISNAIDQKTGTVGVIVRIENNYKDAKLEVRPPLTRGMFVEAILQSSPIKAILVPRNSIRDGKVIVADDKNRLRLVPVEIAFMRDRVAAITGGIEDGTNIVLSTPVPMIEGMLLSPHVDEVLMQEISSYEVNK
ncbi:MAG: HlyD family efflux transporter periplasmic adaptor subunit [Devosiaceae bacterium]|nr:HlyD family efflux transporter periplasmic adaptor subunit [Devosiaceae bacterium]